MRIALLTSDSPWQRALAHRLATVPGAELARVIVQHPTETRSVAWVRRALVREPLRVLDKVEQRVLYPKIYPAIAAEEVRAFGRGGAPLPWPDVPRSDVADINGAESVAALTRLAPDVIAVSGTRLIKLPIFEVAPPLGLLNLHTGISPYYKGGPNCTLWCLANREPQFIGSTIHVLDLGIDSGDIVTTARVEVGACDTLPGLVAGAVALGHELFVRVLSILAAGSRPQSVQQRELGEGRTYYTREWNVQQLGRAVRFVRGGGLRCWVEAGRPGADRVRLVELESENTPSTPPR